jgi:hypothetical protein
MPGCAGHDRTFDVMPAPVAGMTESSMSCPRLPRASTTSVVTDPDSLVKQHGTLNWRHAA